MRYHALFILCTILFSSQAGAQELSFSIAASDRVFPELQLATQIASLTRAEHPTMLGVSVSYWKSSDSGGCRDCSLANRDFVRSGIRLSQSVSNLPFRFAFGAGVRHQIQFIEVVQADAYGSLGKSAYTEVWPEVFIRSDIRVVQHVLLETTIIRGSNFKVDSPDKEYLDLRLGLVYSI